MSQAVDPKDIEIAPLYIARQKIYPQSVAGKFRTIKWALMVFCLGIYYLLPFVRWDRAPPATP